MICGFQKITKNKIVEVKMNGKYFNSLGFSLTKRLFFGLFICCLALDFVFAQVKPPESKIIYQQEEQSVRPVEELSSVPKSITLSPPVMVYPPNNATNVAIVPKFHHKSVVGANRYDLQVATDSSFYSIISYSYRRLLEADTSIRDIERFPSIRSPQDFRNNTVYYWRVRALNTQTGETSNWSSPFRYTTTSPGASLVQPSIVAPANNATTGWLNVKLEWSQVANATWYQVQWSIDNTFDGFTYSVTPGTSPQYIIANLKPMKTYYWKVVAFNDNSISAFSTTYSFQTGNMVTLTDSVGTFDDGSGIDNYENNLDIYWLIKPPNAQRIILSFQSFDTESGYDFVTIYDGETTSAPILGRFSGSSIPPTITSSGGAMLVRFETDGSITEKGWVARYRSVVSFNPNYKELSDFADSLSIIYKVPSVIIKALMEQESEWRQFNEDGTPLINTEPDGRIGIGLMQITVLPSPSAQTLRLGRIDPGNQGSNDFITSWEDVSVDINRLKNDWRYNMEIGVRLLLYKKIESGGAPDDSRILENWYYPLAYYNGAVKGGENDPANQTYSRLVSMNDDWKNKNVFPYQECIYNITAQLYNIPIERRQYFGPPIKVTMPGPASLATGAGKYNYVEAVFCFFDWAIYFRDGTVKIGNWGTKNNGCISEAKTKTGIVVHRVKFGRPTPPEPMLASPANGATSISINPTLIWRASAGAMSYRLQVSTDSTFSSAVFDQGGITDTLKQISGLSKNTRYYWRVNAAITGDTSEWSVVWSFTTTALTLIEQIGSDIPTTYALYQNYPNPFNPATTIEFDLPERSYVRLVVYDVLGREIERLVNEELDAGKYEVNFDASNLSSGVYFYVLDAGKFRDVKKMILVK